MKTEFTNAPKTSERVKPKTDESFIRALDRELWERTSDVFEARMEREGVTDAIARHVLGLYDQNDMRVLAKYGKAGPVDYVTVTVRQKGSRGSFQPMLRVPMPARVGPVRAVDGAVSLTANGDRFSEWPLRGLKPEFVGSETPERLREIYDQQDRIERFFVPKHTESFFMDWLELWERHQRSGGADVRGFIDGFKAENGQYPKWSEVIAAIPGVDEVFAEVEGV